jgi:hypothetical protein
MACVNPIIASLYGEGARLIEISRAGFMILDEVADGLAKSVRSMSNFPENKRENMGKLGKNIMS